MPPAVEGRLRLFCFPHAGGGASFFRDWPHQLPAGVEVWAVQPPGREERCHEPPFTRLSLLVGALVTALRPHLIPPYVFFGHSMGSLVAFELARELQALGWAEPAHLVVSGHRAPTRERSPGLLAPDSDGHLRARLQAYQGTPAELLANDDFVQFLLPTLRADLTVCREYHYEPEPSLTCPLTALGGDGDPEVGVDDLRAWGDVAGGPFAAHTFPGGHFYLVRNAAFFATVADVLRGTGLLAETGAG
jgi:medium-chain acyl-[acyl-carrier-protein] hydrolase